MVDFAQRCLDYRRLVGGQMRQQMPEPAVVYRLVEGLRPRVFVEIGSAWGATLYVYAGACAPGAAVIAVDTGRRAPALEQAVSALRAEGLDAHWVRGDSHSEPVRAEVLRILSSRRVGFLHVDGDHSLDGALADWRDYGPLVEAGGLLAFHDICYDRGRCAVPKAWQRIRSEERIWCEVVGPPWRDGHRLGVGLVWR